MHLVKNLYRLTDISSEPTSFDYPCLYCVPDEQHLPQLELPRDDAKFPTKDGDTFLGKNRFFDFSSADVMPLKEHHVLAERNDVCKPMTRMGSFEAYELRGEQILREGPSTVSRNSRNKPKNE